MKILWDKFYIKPVITFYKCNKFDTLKKRKQSTTLYYSLFLKTKILKIYINFY